MAASALAKRCTPAPFTRRHKGLLMLQLETKGTDREIGRQVAEAFRDWFPRVFDHFAAWLARDLERYRPAVRELRALLAAHCPEVLDETTGMHDVLGGDGDFLLGYRYFNEVRAFVPPGCSGLFLATSNAGPLLARTCDIEPDLGAEIQFCHLRRPTSGPATVLITYLGMTAGLGCNEFGLALTGASAAAHGPATAGLPVAVLNHLLATRCRDVPAAQALLAGRAVRGKGAIELIADAAGRSVQAEFIPGQPVRLTPRRADRDYQACTNFCYSPDVQPLNGPGYLENAYARYGRIVHQIEGGFLPRTVAGVQGLLCDLAQPGPFCPERPRSFHTAYAFVVELAQRRLHLAPGHPARHPFVTMQL